MNRKTSKVLIFVLFLVISGIWMAPVIPNLNDFVFHPNAQFSDVLISHWPNWEFIRRAIHTWDVFPLWNPLILSGAPLIGDPLFGIWYPPNWLCLVLPVGIAINLLFWFHLIWAGLGMFYWMRSEGTHWGGALLAGIGFCGMPKLIGHIGLGHLGLVSAITWTPWLLLVTRRLVNSLSASKSEIRKWFVLGGAVSGICFIADPRWILPSMSLAILYGFRTFHCEKPDFRMFSSTGITSILVGVLIFLGTISGLAIPMIEFTLKSTRMDLSPEEITRLSLPIKNLLGVLVPQYGAWPETITYAGLLILGLALTALLGRARGWLFWLAIGSGSLILALGNQTPIYSILLKLIPGFDFFRVPARFSFLVFFSLSILAGLGLDLFIRKGKDLKDLRLIKLTLTGFCGLTLLLSIGSMLILADGGKEQTISWLHMIFGSILILVLVFYSTSENVARHMMITLWLIPLLLDFFLINRTLIEVRPREELFEKPPGLVTALGSSQDRVFSPSYSIPQHIAVIEGVQMTDGVNPLQLKAYWKYMAEAVGFDPGEYSVTLPPFPDGDPGSPLYQEINIDALGLLNVGMIVSDYPLTSIAHQEVEQIGSIYIYRNPFVRPRAWIEIASTDAEDQWHPIEMIDWSLNYISLKAAGEGLLVLSEIIYPGWVAYVDGDKVDITPYKEILRSIVLPQGEHLVEFYYRPLSVGTGSVLSLMTIIVIVFLWRRR